MQDQITLERIKALHPKLREEALEIYNQICIALTGKAICRFSFTLRSFKDQEALYAQGRTIPGKIVTQAKAGLSYHNYGLACFSDDTEVLTDEGWKCFSELNKKESVMVFKNGELFYEKPLSYISNDYDGDMISIQTRSVDLLVTPNHKMIVQKKINGNWEENWNNILAKDINYQYRIPTAGNFNFSEKIPTFPFNDQMDAETWWEFMGWYLSEGSSCGVSDGIKRKHSSRYKITISQNQNTNEWHYINDCLERTGFKYNYIGHDFIIHSKKLHSVLFELGNSHQKRIPRYLLNAPRNLLEILYESLLLGDGTHYKQRETYWTVNNLLANDFSELCIMLGKSVSINSRYPNEHVLPHGKYLKTFNIQYAVNTRNRKTQELRNGNNNFKCINNEYYQGVVYCVETNAGAIVVKRNGKISICGNCDIVLLIDKDRDGNYETASWDRLLDSDGDNKADWQEIVTIFKQYGWEWGGDWKFKDYPHFQKTFGKSVRDLLSLYNNKKLDKQGYVIL